MWAAISIIFYMFAVIRIASGDHSALNYISAFFNGLAIVIAVDQKESKDGTDKKN